MVGGTGKLALAHGTRPRRPNRGSWPTFECDGGGFEWFGNTPAHLVLTAYGLREFVDMSQVYPVDPEVIRRTRDFLLGKQRDDGSWETEQGGIAEGAINRQQGSIVNTTAYVAWALAESGFSGEALDRARSFLAGKLDGGVDDPYSLGLLLQVFADDADRSRRDQVVARLARIKKEDGDGGVYWASEDPSAFGSTGDVGAMEATALIALGLIETGLEPTMAQGAMDWLVRHKDAMGNWSSTQATIMTLKTLIQAALGGPRDITADVDVIDLGIPPGFDVVAADLERAVGADKIARYELTGRQIIVYVAKLRPGERLRFDVGFEARYPLRAQAPRSQAYLYYDPDVRASTRPVAIEVSDAAAPE